MNGVDQLAGVVARAMEAAGMPRIVWRTVVAGYMVAFALFGWVLAALVGYLLFAVLSNPSRAAAVFASEKYVLQSAGR